MSTVRFVHVAASALNQTPLDWPGNERRILETLAEARARGVTVLCLPELCVTGYGCEDAFFSPSMLLRARDVVARVAAQTRGMIVSIGLPILVKKAIYNSVALLVDGQIAGVVAKRFLPGDGVHYEPRWFKPWPAGARIDVPFGGDLAATGDERLVPMGDLVLDVGGVRIGMEICEDAWVPDRPGSQLAKRGVDLILNPSASHFAFGKHEVRKRFVLEGSRAFGCAYVYSNLLGNEAGRVIYDGGTLIAADAKMVACGPRFSYRETVVTHALVDVLVARARQAAVAGVRPELEHVDTGYVRVPFVWPVLGPHAPSQPGQAAWESGPHVKEEEMTRAVALGLHDYVRKSRSRGFVVSLSGGADSAAVCVLVHDMVQLALAELGLHGLHARLGTPEHAHTPQELTHALLTTLYQPTRNSGPVTRAAALAVATALGAEHHEVDVDALVEGYVKRAEAAIGRGLGWGTDDITLQNIQARVRGPSAWMLANIKGSLLVATSNRSEAAVGYATMDGDTCGGLSPLTGIDKAYLRRWLRWHESPGPEGVGPIAALSKINAQQPTAELRPSEQAQTDEADLMPYDLLDAIEEAFIRDRMAPREVFARVRVAFADKPWSDTDYVIWIERFFILWSRNQWKRERYAIAFHLDDESLDPRTWCRFPILSSGFVTELAELRAEVLG